jgi:hypothetical protein
VKIGETLEDVWKDDLENDILSCGLLLRHFQEHSRKIKWYCENGRSRQAIKLFLPLV